MTVASFAGERLATPVLPGCSRVSLQHAVVTFLLLEVTLFFGCAIAASNYLETAGVLSFSQEQFEAQLKAAAIGAVIYLVAARLYPIYSPSNILDAKLNIKRLILVLLVTFSTLI